MTDERYREIEADINAVLTKDEMDEGWHFCMEFDGLLVKGDPTKDLCGKECIEAEREPVAVEEEYACPTCGQYDNCACPEND